MKKAQFIGLGVIAVFLVLGIGAFRDAATPYVDFDKARSSRSSVQVKGALNIASIRYDQQAGVLRFDLRDARGDRLSVAYPKPEPGNFRHATEVVAVGRYKDGVFQAENLLVKCPSKYQGTDAR